jgi:hypothetical protein
MPSFNGVEISIEDLKAQGFEKTVVWDKGLMSYGRGYIAVYRDAAVGEYTTKAFQTGKGEQVVFGGEYKDTARTTLLNIRDDAQQALNKLEEEEDHNA